MRGKKSQNLIALLDKSTMDSLRFLFESDLYKLDQDMFDKIADTEWIDHTIGACTDDSIGKWDIKALVAIAQCCGKAYKKTAESLLIKWVEHYSEE